ncbi:beta-aspartyl-peptidase [Cytobacillus sp. FJAT-54145]|uniref:Isoaspartyl dipeptidase n=1 Tax=Cytobacillus spartinae TaxID=3299023 RepID=A0ABW6KB30_9BACI
MLKLLKGGEVYAPAYLGKKDVLLVDGRVGLIKEDIEAVNSLPIEVIDATGTYIVPGFIDSHVHITGGGGEGSFRTRTPELNLSDATTAGITTMVGVLGTDGTTRTMPELIAKARALEEEGITCFVHTGSYQVPLRSLTGRVQDDIILIDKIIGVGEIAIADHRSSQPTFDELTRLTAEARVAGILSGKAGIVNIHVGDSDTRLKLLEEIVENTDLPITQFHPTHINRNGELFEVGIEFAKKGGYVDFTTSTIPKFLEEGEVKCSIGLKRMLEAGVPIDQITFTSDGQASLPEFDHNGDFVGLQVGKVSSLYREVKDAILNENIAPDTALKVITENPAKVLKLGRKGKIEVGRDADIVLIEKDTLDINTVIAMGKVMVRNKEVVVKGTFE